MFLYLHRQGTAFVLCEGDFFFLHIASMPPGLETVLRRQRRWAILNWRDYMRSRDRNLQGHLNSLPRYRRMYRDSLVLYAKKARERISRDTIALREAEQTYLAKGLHANAIKLMTEADMVAMRQAHASEFRLNVRQEMITRYLGILLLPLVGSWQDCLNLKAERNRILARMESERKALLPNCNRLRAEHRRLLRAFRLF